MTQYFKEFGSLIFVMFSNTYVHGVVSICIKTSLILLFFFFLFKKVKLQYALTLRSSDVYGSLYVYNYIRAWA